MEGDGGWKQNQLPLLLKWKIGSPNDILLLNLKEKNLDHMVILIATF